MPQHRTHHATAEHVAGRIIRTAPNGLAIDPCQDFVERRGQQDPGVTQRQTGRHVAGRIDGDTIPPRITWFQIPLVEPTHVVSKIPPKVSPGDQPRTQDLLEHRRHDPTIVLQASGNLSIPLYAPVVAPTTGRNPLARAKRTTSRTSSRFRSLTIHVRNFSCGKASSHVIPSNTAGN